MTIYAYHESATIKISKLINSHISLIYQKTGSIFFVITIQANQEASLKSLTNYCFPAKISQKEFKAESESL